MDKSLCFYFQVHQPDRLRLYRFFDIGNDSQYFDEFANRTILRRIADRCYLPMNAIILELIHKYKGEFKVAYSISAINQTQKTQSLGVISLIYREIKRGTLHLSFKYFFRRRHEYICFSIT